jgi:hypothetical protein
MAELPTDITSQTQNRLIDLLVLVEKDKASLQSAKPEIARAGMEIYDQFIDQIRRGLENLDTDAMQP